MVGVHHTNALNFVANRNTAAAENAFGTVADDRWARTVDHILRFDPFKPEPIDLNLLAQILKFTVLVAVASKAVLWMVR